MVDFIDTNVRGYRFDPRDPRKQAVATRLLGAGIADGNARLAHQSVLEFVAAVTKAGTRSLPVAVKLAWTLR